jgi:hypothetical protein
MRKSLLKLIVVVFFLQLSNLTSAQHTNTIQFSHTFPPDTLNFTVKMLDSIEHSIFTMEPVNYGYYRFQVIAGEDSMVIGKIITVYLGEVEFFNFYSPLSIGWIGNIKVIRTWLSYDPFVSYKMEHIYKPGEIYTNSRKSFHFR